MKQVISVLSKVQKDLNVAKKRYNQFAKYYYRNAEDIIEATKQIMPDGCTITMSDEIWMVGDRFYVKATAAFSYMGESMSCTGYAREPLEKKGSDSSQITGGCSTYARRYALAGLLAIDDGEDTDNHDNRDQPKVQQFSKAFPDAKIEHGGTGSSNFITKEQEFELSKLMFEAKADSKAFNESYGIKTFSQLTQEQYKDAIKKLNVKLGKKAVNHVDYASV